MVWIYALRVRTCRRNTRSLRGSSLRPAEGFDGESGRGPALPVGSPDTAEVQGIVNRNSDLFWYGCI